MVRDRGLRVPAQKVETTRDDGWAVWDIPGVSEDMLDDDTQRRTA